MQKIILLISIIVLFNKLAFSQFGFQYSPDIKVVRNGDTLLNPWSGGLNYPQFSDFDFDFDGDLDLFIFDRSSNNIIVLTQESGPNGPFYQNFYKASDYFPTDIRYRATLVDYDNDGRKDLFTYGIGGMKVYRNTGDLANGLQWELISNLLYSQYPNNYTNLYVSSSDIPAIVDVDFDGDIDILTFDISGQHVEYHQNQSMDLYGIPDSLIFELKNECWGKFSEDLNTSSVILNDPNAPCSGGSIPNPQKDDKPLPDYGVFKHSGSTILALDYDNSGVLDLIVGDVSYSNMNLLINGGSAPNTNSAMISVETSFPSNTTPVDVELFPAAYFVDVNFDDVKDLIACPNAKNISENEHSVHYYLNNGSNANPNFIYQADNYLQSEMIEHGTGSIPVLYDYNEDGKKDLIIANFFRFLPGLNKESTIALYLNTGTATNPVYQYIDYDIFNLSAQAYGLRSVPTFGDIDNDGDEDMFIGLENGTLVYYENHSTGSGAVFTTGIQNYTDANATVINSGGYCFPQLFDLDKDNLLDLIIGRKDGEVMFYKNTGTASTPSFTYMNNLGQVDVSTVTPDGYAAPHFFRLNDTTHLFIGADEGNLWYYSDIDNHIGNSDTFNLVSSQYLDIEVNRFSSFFVDDIDNDGKLNMFVGHDLGGLYHFEADPSSTIGISEQVIAEPEILIYPNPVSDELNIKLYDHSEGHYIIHDASGRIILQGEIIYPITHVNTDALRSGMYFVNVTLSNGIEASRKLIKQY